MKSHDPLWPCGKMHIRPVGRCTCAHAPFLAASSSTDALCISEVSAARRTAVSPLKYAGAPITNPPHSSRVRRCPNRYISTIPRLARPANGANELPRLAGGASAGRHERCPPTSAGHRSSEGDCLFPFRLRSPYAAAHEVFVDDLLFTAADVVLDEGPPLRLVGLPGVTGCRSRPTAWPGRIWPGGRMELGG